MSPPSTTTVVTRRINWCFENLAKNFLSRVFFGIEPLYPPVLYSPLSMVDMPAPNQIKYRNITISGLPGAGSTTLGKLLSTQLGWERYSGGDFMRQYAIEKGYFDPKQTVHHAATVYPDDFDRQVDYDLRKKLVEKQHNVYESWLSGFLAQGVADTLKILVYCSDDAVRVDRIANRDNVSIDEAKKHIFDREDQNLAKWAKMYKSEWQEWVVARGVVPDGEPIYFWKPELYDLVIDTFGHGKEATLELAMQKLRS